MLSVQAGASRRPHWRSHTKQLIVFGLAGVVLLPACGGGGATVNAIITTTSSPAAAPTTAAPATTTATTTTTSTTTTLAPTTTTSSTTTTTTTAVESTTTTSPPVSYAQAAPQQATPTFPSNANAREAAALIGTIRIPKIGVDMKLYDGVTMPTLDLGPGHWPGTAWAGQAGNMVIGGHRTSKHAVFRHIDDLSAGDQIVVEDSNGVHTYAVTRTQIIEPTDVWIVNPTPTATITLFACHPPGSTRQRIVVFGDLVS